jgi:putative oxidoreductase
MTTPASTPFPTTGMTRNPPGWRRRLNHAADRLSALPMDLVLAPAARLAMAAVFWLSGRTKVEGWLTVSDNAVTLFAQEYKLPLVSPELAAHAAAYAEHLLPALLVLGLFTRWSALVAAGHDRGDPGAGVSGCLADAPDLGCAIDLPRLARRWRGVAGPLAAPAIGPARCEAWRGAGGWAGRRAGQPHSRYRRGLCQLRSAPSP